MGSHCSSSSTCRRELELLLPPSALSASVPQLPQTSWTASSCPAPPPSPPCPAPGRAAPEGSHTLCSSTPVTPPVCAQGAAAGVPEVPGPTETPAPSTRALDLYHPCAAGPWEEAPTAWSTDTPTQPQNTSLPRQWLSAEQGGLAPGFCFACSAAVTYVSCSTHWGCGSGPGALTRAVSQGSTGTSAGADQPGLGVLWATQVLGQQKAPQFLCFLRLPLSRGHFSPCPRMSNSPPQGCEGSGQSGTASPNPTQPGVYRNSNTLHPAISSPPQHTPHPLVL